MGGDPLCTRRAALCARQKKMRPDRCPAAKKYTYALAGYAGIKIAGLPPDLTSCPEGSPDVRPEAFPDVRPEAFPDVRPEAFPDGHLEAFPDGHPEAFPDVLREESPDALPEESPDASARRRGQRSSERAGPAPRLHKLSSA
jgi:hypothetical protein